MLLRFLGSLLTVCGFCTIVSLFAIEPNEGTQCPGCSTEVEVSDNCKTLLKALKHVVISRGSLEWPSLFLSAKPLQSLRQVKAIVHDVFSSAGLQGELAEQMEKLGGIQSPALWDEYFRVYDQFVFYSNGYLGILRSADNYLPPSGLLVDWGAGTGNFSAGLLFSQPERKIHSVDLSEVGLAKARAKLKTLDPSESRFTLSQVNLVTDELPMIAPESLDGGVMNNVLYAIPGDRRLPVLKKIFKRMKPGATLVLNDPIPQSQVDAVQTELFLTAIAESAFINGSPANGFDLALLAGINRSILVGSTSTNQFLAPEAMRDLCEQAGFHVRTEERTYYGGSRLYVLKKPKVNKR